MFARSALKRTNSRTSRTSSESAAFPRTSSIPRLPSAVPFPSRTSLPPSSKVPGLNTRTPTLPRKRERELQERPTIPLVDGHEITVTHRDKVLFPADGITKGELAEYFQRIAPRMIPHVRDRPLHMNRFPGGIQYNPIQQKRVPDSFPSWIKRTTLDLQRGGTITHAVIDNAATLVYLVQYNVVTVRVWLSCIQALNQRAQVMFDLAPADEDSGLVRETALTL